MHEFAPVPPAPVVLDDGAYAAGSLPLRARWSMPPDKPAVPSFPVVEYLFALGSSPSDPGAGYTISWTSAGSSQAAAVEGAGLLAGVEYYWYVRARDSSGLVGPAGVSDGIRIASRAVSSPGAAKDLPDGTTVSIGRLVVTATAFPSDSQMYVMSRHWTAPAALASYADRPRRLGTGLLSLASWRRSIRVSGC